MAPRPHLVPEPVPGGHVRQYPVSGVVIHSMGEYIEAGGTHHPAAEFLRHSKDLTGSSYSAHCLVAPAGSIFRCVGTERVAYHAGVSEWGGQEVVGPSGLPSLNERWLGIEVLAPGAWEYGAFRRALVAGEVEFTPEQYRSLGYQLAEWIREYEILEQNVQGHSAVATDDLRGPGKGKRDPGAAFDWDLMWTEVSAWITEFEEEDRARA